MSKSDKSKKKSAKPEADAPAAKDTASPTLLDKPSKSEKKRKRNDDVAGEEAKPKKSKKQKSESKSTSNNAAAKPASSSKDKESTPMDVDTEIVAPAASKDATNEKKKESKKKRKSKKADNESAQESASAEGQEEKVPEGTEGTAEADEKDTGAKKSKKKSKKNKEAASNEAPIQDDAENGVLGDSSNGTTEAGASGKKNRFTVFVGNLPFSATKEQLQAHFEKLAPKDIRIMTDKQTKKPKGFAFIDFENFDRMETCLKKFNHSVFPDGKNGRKINVELTAGGGGNSEFRKEKLQSKNAKLQEERQREREKREEIEAKQEERKKKKESKQKKGKKGDAGGESAAEPVKQSNEHGGIHPSRLAMMQAPAPPRSQSHRQRF